MIILASCNKFLKNSVMKSNLRWIEIESKHSKIRSRPSRQWTTVFYPAVIATLFGRVWAQNYNHRQKSWDTFAFLGRFPIHTGPTTPLIPQNNVGRVYPDFFASFNFKVLYMQKLRCNYNINICNPSNFKKFFCALPTITDTKPRSRGCPQ